VAPLLGAAVAAPFGFPACLWPRGSVFAFGRISSLAIASSQNLIADLKFPQNQGHIVAPKPIELDSTTSSSAWRAWLGT